MKNTRTILLILLSICSFNNSAFAKNKVTNILWIITDEHNFRTLGCYRDLLPKEQALMWGETVVETPNIDWLAQNGATFTRMYSSSPVCSPCRASMFTGQYPHTVNVPNNDRIMSVNHPTIADVLSKEGYSTGYSGKWHLSGDAKPGWEPQPSYGFQDNRYMFNRGHWKKLGFDDDNKPEVATKDKNGKPTAFVSNADESTFTTDWLADRTIDFIEKNKDQAFYYVVSIPDPHGPNSVRAPYNKMYTDVDFKIPETYYNKKPNNKPKWREDDPKIKNEAYIKDILTQYYGMVKCIDDNVGRIIKKLEEEDLLDNTIILFSSDHGDLMGEHKRVNKGVPFEGSAKIPFIIYNKRKIKPGTVVSKAANATDWMPTFLDMVDIKKTPKMAGRNLTPLLENPDLKKWDDITFSRFGSWVAAFDSRYKFIIDSSGAEPWLMDIEKDPNELTNYYNNPNYKDIVLHLANQLNNYLVEQDDPLANNEKVLLKLSEALNNHNKSSK